MKGRDRLDASLAAAAFVAALGVTVYLWWPAGQVEAGLFCPDDVQTVRLGESLYLCQGEGWGLALPAELNGVPGPAHLLELKDEIMLSETQVAEIELAYEEMRAAAIAAGERYIEGERKLEQAFADRSVKEKSLRAMLRAIGERRAELRYSHLSTHLRTPAILTEEQIRRYNKLRGYGAE